MADYKPSTVRVRGIKVSNRTQRRYSLIAVRERAVTTDAGTFVPFANIWQRSDNLAKLRQVQDRQQRLGGVGMEFVIIDTLDGTEVKR